MTRLAVVLLSIVFSFVIQPVYARELTIAVAQIVSHPALDAIREGFKSELRKNGYREGENLKIIYGNPYGDLEKSDQISERLVSSSPDLILAITTPSARSVLKARKDAVIPVVFSAVTDPVRAGLVNSMETPGEFVTGTTDFPPLRKQFALIRHILGKKTIRLGVVYNDLEDGTFYQIEKMNEIAKDYKIELIVVRASTPEKMIKAVHDLIPRVDAFYTPVDNTPPHVLKDMVQLCLENEYKIKIPMFSSEPEGVRQGALASVGSTNFEQGVLAGRIVLRLLAGEQAIQIPVARPEARDVYVNVTTAKSLGITLPKTYPESDGEVVRFE